MSDQDWFWTDGWQAMEREADEDIREGRFLRFKKIEDLLNSLHMPAIDVFDYRGKMFMSVSQEKRK